MDWTKQMVIGSDGIHLATFDGGRRDAPTVLLAHGFPDDHRVWDGVAALLATDFRVIAFDVRGAGQSGVPADRRGYRVDQLAADIATVAALADGPVHLLAHDWGSVQGWHAVTRPGARARFASFTSISGPDLAMSGAWLAATRKSDWRAVLSQASKSWYLQAFRAPLLPELFWRSGLGFRSAGRAKTVASVDNAVNGLNLYRANLARSSGIGRPERCEVPVLVLAPRYDRFVGVHMQTEAPVPWTTSLQSEVIDGGHWVVEKHPDRIVEPVKAFIGGLS